MDAENLFLGDDDVSGSALDTIFAGDLTPHDLSCGDLDASTAFCSVECDSPGRKRSRDEDEEDEKQLFELQEEAERLRRINFLLKSSFECIRQKADSELTEQQRLHGLVRALQPHRAAFRVRPLASQRSSVDSSRTADPADAFLSLSPSRSQPGPAERAMTPARDVRRVKSASLPCARGAAFEEALPEKLEEDPRTAHAAAVAAAALAVNGGSPGAALVHLLNLAMTRRAERQAETPIAAVQCAPANG